MPQLHVCDANRYRNIADHYIASLTGMLPTDPLKLAEADQFYFFMEDVFAVSSLPLRRPLNRFLVRNSFTNSSVATLSMDEDACAITRKLLLQRLPVVHTGKHPAHD